MLVHIMLLGSQVAGMLSNGDPTAGVCNAKPYGVYPCQVYVPPGDGVCPTPGVH